MKYFLLVVLLLGVTSASESSTVRAQNADFSGKWIFNPSKSEGVPTRLSDPRRFAKTVSQNRELAQFTVTTDFILGPSFSDKSLPVAHLPITLRVATYDLTGQESSVPAAGMAPAVVMKAEWKGESLELSHLITSTYNGRESVRKVTELWELSKDGKELSISQTIDVYTLKQFSRFVFDKQ